MQRIFHTPEGVRDITGEECAQKQRLQEKLRDVFRRYGCREIETPTFEYFEVFGNEVPVILDVDGEPFAAGRLDLLLREGDKIGIGDIKRTSALDKDYLSYQLTLYAMAFEQSYGVKIEFLRGLHLREDVRKYVKIPFCVELAEDLLKEYAERKEGINNE